jgi:peptidyl-prolyl cis-trans isomerase A (cyclophilin A)
MLLLLACIGTKTPDDSATDDSSATTDDSTVVDGPVQVEMTTTMGAFTIELDSDVAPNTVANFLVYVDEGFYDGSDGGDPTLFHRVIPGFMIQGGGVVPDGSQKTTHDPIDMESSTDARNVRGAIAMARTNDPDSATSQFFVNVADNPSLDVDGNYPPGYAVFGMVTEGMDVVDAIVAVPRNGADRPDTDIVIEGAERL